MRVGHLLPVGEESLHVLDCLCVCGPVLIPKERLKDFEEEEQLIAAYEHNAFDQANPETDYDLRFE